MKHSIFPVVHSTISPFYHSIPPNVDTRLIYLCAEELSHESYIFLCVFTAIPSSLGHYYKCKRRPHGHMVWPAIFSIHYLVHHQKLHDDGETTTTTATHFPDIQPRSIWKQRYFPNRANPVGRRPHANFTITDRYQFKIA